MSPPSRQAPVTPLASGARHAPRVRRPSRPSRQALVTSLASGARHVPHVRHSSRPSRQAPVTSLQQAPDTSLGPKDLPPGSPTRILRGPGAGPAVGRLTSLDLSGNSCGPAGATALAEVNLSSVSAETTHTHTPFLFSLSFSTSFSISLYLSASPFTYTRTNHTSVQSLWTKPYRTLDIRVG